MSLFWFALLGFFNTPTSIEIVQSPKDPGPYTLTFEEDLRFGGEEEEDEYLWVDGAAPADFTVDSRGHFFIMDGKNSNILEFDVNGKFLRIFAERGEGPGEFQNLGRFQILADGRAIGFDSLQATTKFSYYNQKLEYQNTETKTGMNEIIVRPTFSPDGHHFYAWFMQFDLKTNKMKFKTGIFDEKRVLKKELSSQNWPLPDQSRIGESEMWVDFLAKQFDSLLNRGSVFANFLPNQSILIADGTKYEIQKWTSDLKTQTHTFKKDYDPIAYTEEDKSALVTFIEETIFAQGGSQLSSIITKNVIARAIEKANIPAFKNPLLAITSMEDNQFIVFRDTNFATGTFMAEIFNEKGRCIGRFNSPGTGIYSFFGARLVFRNGFVYAMEKTEEGDNQMARYRYKLVKK